jgi:ribonuclease III
MDKLRHLQKALGYRFSDRALLELALSHRSVGGRNNERLEFLGDSVVNHIVAEELYRRFPEAREGQMSRMRASLVKGETLAQLATELGMGECLALGPGERKSGGYRRTSILADAFEAVAGAMLIDSDFEQCRHCLAALFASRLEALSPGRNDKDAKTRLQEYLQARQSPLPDYQLVDVSGEDHLQHFHVKCRLSRPQLTVDGRGSSRRRAEQAAASAALEALTS